MTPLTILTIKILIATSSLTYCFYKLYKYFKGKMLTFTEQSDAFLSLLLSGILLNGMLTNEIILKPHESGSILLNINNTIISIIYIAIILLESVCLAYFFYKCYQHRTTGLTKEEQSKALIFLQVGICLILILINN